MSANINNKTNAAKRHDVAQLAGVSDTTVSFVFSKKRYVSPDLADRVMWAAKQLNYYPDMVAASMGRGKTNSIAVLTEDIVSPLQMEIIKVIQESAINEGYFVYICGGTNRLDKYLNNIISRKVDGVFLSVTPAAINNAMMLDVLDRGISVIITSNRGFPDDRVCGLELDFTDGMQQIITHLAELGHRKIAYLSYCGESAPDHRLPAFKTYMKKILDVDEPLIEMGQAPYPSNMESGSELMNRLLNRTRDFSAVVCTNDLMAYGAMTVLRNKGLDIPGRVSVVGIDDINFSSITNPPLTTLSHRCDVYGKRIFDILMDNINDKSLVRRDVIQPKLIVRQSTAKCCFNV